jgi:two-component system OmpR family sensor kinase
MSLRLRLALWYSSLTGLIVLSLGLLAYAIHSRAEYDGVDYDLRRAVTHAADSQPAGSLLGEAAPLLVRPLLPSIGMRLYGPEGKVVAASPNAILAPPVDPRAILAAPAGPAYDFLAGLVPPFTTVSPQRGAFGSIEDTEHHRWRIYILPAEGGIGYFGAVASLASVDAAIADLRRLMPPLAVVGALVTLVGGGLLAGRSLRPVATLTATARMIARSREFSQRVPLGARRDELGILAATFNEMLDALEDAYRSQQRFVADASHELRTPLAAIQANLELLQRQSQMPLAERQEAINEATREAQRLSRLVADLLVLARADAGVVLEREIVELDGVVVAAFRAAQASARGQCLVLEPFEPISIMGNEDRLRQMLLILLDNALKYTPPDGRVTLRLRRWEDQAALAVCDTGVGIAPDQLSHVFERFFRADPARGRDAGGMGLGLPIARWIVEQHGGTIRLQSQPDHGTTVTVLLPLA